MDFFMKYNKPLSIKVEGFQTNDVEINYSERRDVFEVFPNARDL